jgi:hypothetical protein
MSDLQRRFKFKNPGKVPKSNQARMGNQRRPKKNNKRNRNKNRGPRKLNRPVKFGRVSGARSISRVKLHPLTYNWIEALIDPINNVRPVILPDGKLIKSISLTDFNSVTNVTAQFPGTIVTPVPSIGYLMYFNYGTNLMVGSSFYSVAPTHGYWMQILPLDPNGDVIFDDNFHIPHPYYFSNNGGTGGAAQDISELTKAYRLLAAGFQILPKIELATESSSQRVSHYYGGQININDVALGITNGDSMQQLILSSPYIQQYTNKYGLCLRYNPCQDTRQVNFYNELELSDTTKFEFGTFYQPAVAVYFTQVINATTVDGLQTYVYPTLWNSKLWLEGDLILPSPIAMSMTAKDIMILTIMRYLNNNQLFPLVVEGHSFHNFSTKVRAFDNQLSKAINFAGGNMISALG